MKDKRLLEEFRNHKSESLVNVKYVADALNLKTDSGIKGKSGILKSIETSEEFLAPPSK